MLAEPWALVLAAGDGRRLQSLTHDGAGNVIPKQFCALHGESSLLLNTLRRAAKVVPWTRIVTVVAEQHEMWWRDEIGLLTPANVVVQPRNRGTAVGLLLPLLRIIDRDPQARVVILPSDHFVADESVMRRAMSEALAEVERRPERVVLLGIEPDAPDQELGWILPSDRVTSGPRDVRRFVEKPSADIAARLMREGGVWNSFILSGTAGTLLEMFRERLPEVVAALWDEQGVPAADGLRRVYERLDSSDFCRDVLEGLEQRLSVLAVPRCGWCDLGTPARVSRCVDYIQSCRTEPPPPSTLSATLGLLEDAIPHLGQSIESRLDHPVSPRNLAQALMLQQLQPLDD